MDKRYKLNDAVKVETVRDILDIDAPCGGYNLSNAFLSGMKVGEEVE